MRTNSHITIYAKSVAAGTEVWTRSTVLNVAWFDRRATNARQSANIKADDIAVYIPMARGTIAIKVGDVLVRDVVTDAISAGFTISDLRAKYPDSAIVRTVDQFDMGSSALWHWQIGAS
jgi:hypothetical protein